MAQKKRIVPDVRAHGDQRGAAVVAAQSADMTRRVDAILLTGPLHAVAADVSRRAAAAGERVDGLRVCLTVIREVGLRTTFDEGPTPQETKQVAFDAVLEQAPDIQTADAWETADVAVKGLDAYREPDRRYAVDWFNDASGQVETRSFAYLEFARGSDESYRYRTTAEAGVVYAFIADRDISDAAQRVMDKLVNEAIGRGDVDRAMGLSMTKRGMALGLMSRIRSLIADLSANPEAARWSADLSPRVKEAQAHLRERIEEHSRIDAHVRDRQEEWLGTDNAWKLSEFATYLTEESKTLNRLLMEVVTASQRFSEHQARGFALRSASVALDPLEAVRNVLRSETEAAVAGFGDLLPRILPPHVESMRLFELGPFFAAFGKAFLQVNDQSGELPDTEPATVIGVDPVLEAAEAAKAEGFLEGRLNAAKSGSAMSDLVEAAVAFGGVDFGRHVGFLCMGLAGQVSDGTGYASAIGDKFATAVMRGDDIVFERISK